MKKLYTPALSTGFSENGKKAKSRFENILSKSKKRSVFLVVSLLCAIIAAEFLVACTGESTEKIADDIENQIVIIGGADDPTNIWVTPSYVVSTAAISTHAPLFYDKAMLYQNKDYITNPEMTTLANAYPVDGRTDIFFVSLPAFHGGLFGYTKAENLKFIFKDEDYDYAQILEDMPEHEVFEGDTVRIDARNENVFTVTALSNESSFDIDKAYVGIIEDHMAVYPHIYDYLESEIVKYAGEEFDNVMIDKIGFFRGRESYDEESKVHDCTINVQLTYTEKNLNQDDLDYIRDAVASGDYNRLTYRDDRNLFIHAMIPQMRIRFKFDKQMKIEKSSVSLSYNAGQIITNMPVENPREEWTDVENIGAIFPEKLSEITYNKNTAVTE